MFYEKQIEEEKTKYKEMLKIMGSLTLLFSDSDTPYLPYRCHENIFCKYFNAENLGRKDCSADAKKSTTGIGLKTWVGNNDQKIAEFGKKLSSFKDLSGMKLVKTIAEYRNERIKITKNMYNIEQMVYHIVKRVPGMMQIFEHAFDEIDVNNIKLLEDKGKENNIYFEDGHHTYHFSKSKNTLYMLFENLDKLDSFYVNILEDPYSYLMNKNIENKNIISITDFKEKEENIKEKQLCLRLYAIKKGEKYVPQKSGLNQWNARGRNRHEDKLYIPYLTVDRNRNRDYFPPKDQPFDLILPDGKIISAKVCQEAHSKLSKEKYSMLSTQEKEEEDKRRLEGKAIMSNPNKELGNWLLRKVFELPPRTLITYKMLEKFGIDSVIFTKISDRKYSIDFSEIGTYEDFYE